MSLLRVITFDGPCRIETTGDVILALTSGALALRRRAEKLAEHPDADEQSEGIIASWLEDASILDRLAGELRA